MLPVRLLLASATFACVALAAQCQVPADDDDSSPPPDEAAGTLDDLVDGWLDYVEICNFGTQAFGAQVEPDGVPPSRLTLVGVLLKTRYALAAESEHVIIHEDAIPACLAACRAPTECSETLPSVCDSVFEGTRSAGDPCASGFECTSALCGGATPDQCGACGEAFPPAGEGDACTNPSACADGLYCDLDLSLCAARHVVGDSCSVAVLRQCVEGARCEGSPSQCVDVLPIGTGVGDPCDPGEEACGESILSGLACKGTLGAEQCVAASVVEEGDVCDTHGERDPNGARWCSNAFSTHYCDIAFDADEGLCQQRPDVGDACNTNVPCNALTSTCSATFSGTCVAFAANGAACAGFQFCTPGLFCVGDPATCQEDFIFAAPVCTEP